MIYSRGDEKSLYLLWKTVSIKTKFDGVDYAHTFARRISVMYHLVTCVLKDMLHDGDTIIDIGGGPGMGARIIEDLGITATLTNIEPSTSIRDIPPLSHVDYVPLQMTFQEALDVQIPHKADVLLMVSSAHEIALWYNRSPRENKTLFFADLNVFIRNKLKRNGHLVIGYPNYRTGASPEEIAKQRILTESLLGHSHPPEELFTVEEFSCAFDAQPMVHINKEMDLIQENPNDTILMANVVAFNHTTL